MELLNLREQLKLLRRAERDVEVAQAGQEWSGKLAKPMAVCAVEQHAQVEAGQMQSKDSKYLSQLNFQECMA
jgi:hypothetical protein